jgi:hypothetical protein
MKSASNVTYAVLVILFVLGTYALALSLESIIDSFSKISAKRDTNRERRESPDNQIRDENDVSRRWWNRIPNSYGLRKRHRSSENGEAPEKISFSA